MRLIRFLPASKPYGALGGRGKNWLASSLTGLLMLGCPSFAEPVEIVALGDSLTAGYGLAPDDGFVPQLQRWLRTNGADVTVVNAGVSGDTTAGALARLDWALSTTADAVIVTLGGNDLLRGLSPAEAKGNLEAILSNISQRGLPVLLVPISAPGNYGADYKADFDAIYPELASRYEAQLSAPFLNPILALPDRNSAMATYVQPDGLHPNAKGVALVVESLGPNVQALLTKVN
ncbi:MAG: arylesterase [Albidovulum sp.]